MTSQVMQYSGIAVKLNKVYKLMHPKLVNAAQSSILGYCVTSKATKARMTIRYRTQYAYPRSRGNQLRVVSLN